MADTYVLHTQDDFASALSDLLPTGIAWPREDDSPLMQVVNGLAGPWADAAVSADTLLITESDPGKTIAMLPDWELNFGLPDDCVAEPQTIFGRRQALIQKMTMLGGQSRAFFIAAALAIGYSISITEYAPFMCGVSQCGDTSGVVLNPDTPSQYRWQLGPPTIRFYWTIHVNTLKITHFHTGSGQTGIDRLLGIGLATDLECILRRYKPGHTEIVFDYAAFSTMDFSAPFNSGYLMMGFG